VVATVADTIAIPTPRVPYGPDGVEPRFATAMYLDSVLSKLRALDDDGHRRIHIGGSNVTATVERILGDVAMALRADALQHDDQGLASEVLEERGRQDLKWGPPQNLPDGTGPDTWPLADLAWAGHDSPVPRTMTLISAAQLAEAAKANCEAASRNGQTTYADIFIEEVAEALAESDQAKLREELIQVAAVALKWVRVIDERPAATS
jgi:hypothetical protein